MDAITWAPICAQAQAALGQRIGRVGEEEIKLNCSPFARIFARIFPFGLVSSVLVLLSRLLNLLPANLLCLILATVLLCPAQHFVLGAFRATGWPETVAGQLGVCAVLFAFKLRFLSSKKRKLEKKTSNLLTLELQQLLSKGCLPPEARKPLVAGLLALLRLQTDHSQL